MIQIVTNEQLEQILAESLKLFPVQLEYDDDMGCAIDENRAAREAWQDEQVELLENVVNIDRYIKTQL